MRLNGCDMRCEWLPFISTVWKGEWEVLIELKLER